MPIDNQREYRVLPNILNLQAENKRLDTEFYVEGYATTFNEEYDLAPDWKGVMWREKIDANALEGADLSDVIFQYDHRGKVLARNSNNTLIVENDTKGVKICGDLSKSSAAKDLYEEIKNGLVTRMSWGFTVAEDNWNKETHVRTIYKIKKVYDVSAVSIPANDGTSISARTLMEGRHDIEQRESLENRKKILLLKIKLGEQK